MVGIHILSQTLLLSKGLVFKQLLDNARQETIRVWAEGSPFESKDILKKRGYKFDGEKRRWFIEVVPDQVEEEKRYLCSEIYRCEKEIVTTKINAFNRFF